MHKPLKRKYSYIVDHALDNRKNLGYDYRENIFKKTMSNQLFVNPDSNKILTEIQKIVYFLIEQVKLLKTRYLISVDKDYNQIN